MDLLHGSDPETANDKRDGETAEAVPRRSTRVSRPFESTNLTIHVQPNSTKEATTRLKEGGYGSVR